jgi:hypothetical protein
LRLAVHILHQKNAAIIRKGLTQLFKDLFRKLFHVLQGCQQAHRTRQRFGSATPFLFGRIKLGVFTGGFFRHIVPKGLREFLVGAVEQLSNITEGSLEVPVSIIRAINDGERIALIEETAMSTENQAVLRCRILQIARLAGENG